MKPKVVVIVGPTAVGKTKLSIEIAKKFNGEIISGDSMQVYRGMDIGTAKISREEMAGIPHYMLDIKDPDEAFSVADFKEHVQSYIAHIDSKSKLPILVGGSGLYIQAILYDYQFTNHKRDEAYTTKLEERIKLEGIAPVYEQLKRIDPEQAKKIHPNNHRRVIRALEIYRQTGKTMSELLRDEESQKSPYDPIIIGLEMDRPLLYERINQRVDRMLEEGLLEEVHTLYKKGYENTQAMRAIGYKEFIPYFKEEYYYTRAIELLKRNSRRYAKRQFTWFKNKMKVDWYGIRPETINKQFQIILQDLAGLLKD
ncbi:MAG TPA: tRNA (adenosine(37)-N6)-dimethylallyltransferase MiaA [Cerasibacillus sp.]|uniref:tRNA (adenosine(37)-N6)-dimethylallyltransferase MiaA n=1 Tax=Cerasibacillus sp. TaxID=2498711 RepID=UPI002F412703